MSRKTTTAIAVCAAFAVLAGSPAYADPTDDPGQVEPVDYADDGTPIWLSEADAYAFSPEPGEIPGEGTDPGEEEPGDIPGEEEPGDIPGEENGLAAAQAKKCSISVRPPLISSRIFRKKFATFVENNTGQKQKFSFTATKTGTETYSVGAKVSGEISAGVFAKISAEVNAGIEKSMSTSYGVRTSGTVKARSTINGDHGIYVQRQGWRSSNCGPLGGSASATAGAPYKTGWKIYYS
ncbi:hypothetical protein [Planomonospora sp. ID82291]|uniref:hypothetical protein n=1 Tax=Planomonospora sp. ID82291 TaxID=2738136 RepID=UPI0018C45077|nr:hypothetical protein [Planomonospora sp. ID82291]MBG0818010.1 hypothetical protein [Planomonospora sp. ID82291]